MSEIITGSIEISAGIVSSGLTVDAGGDVTVLSGGTVTDAEAVNYGYFWVEEGGYIGRIRVTNSGDAMVNGGLAEDLTMESGGMADVFSGVMRTGTILNGGYGAIYETGSGLDVAVSAGGRYLVNGGYAENTVVSNGGSFTVQLGSGLADKTTIEAGGHARIVSGGQMWETILNGGRVDVISGTILATTINGGELHVSSGGPELASGYVENTILNSGSLLVSSASAKDTTVNGGSFIVSGGTAQITTVNTGGSFLVSGGTAQNTTVSGGAFIISSGTAQNTVATNGGEVTILSAGFAEGTSVVGGSVMVSGGTVQNTTLGIGTSPVGPVNPDPVSTGTIIIDIPDGPIIWPIFTSGIILDPSSFILVSDSSYYLTGYGDGSVPYLIVGGATVSLLDAAAMTAAGETWVNPVQVANMAEDTGEETSSGTNEATLLTLLNGALAVNTTVHYGEMRICDGAAATSTTVYGGGSMLVSGGTATSTTVHSSGALTVSGGIVDTVTLGASSATATVFADGRVLNAYLSSGSMNLEGGTVTGATVYGGTMSVRNGGQADDVVMYYGYIQAADGGTIRGATVTVGEIIIMAGGTLSGATIGASYVRIKDGGTLSSAFTIAANADFYMESGSVVAFDITNMTPGAEAESSGLANIWGAPVFTLTVSDVQAAGVYALSAEAAGFRDAITVQNKFGVQLGTLTVGNTAFLNNQYYTLRVTDNVLNLTVSNEAPARMWDPAIVFVNPEWSSLPEGSTVEPVPGLELYATIGLDAFATGRDATNAVAGDGTVVVAGGEASFQYGITRDTAAWTGATVTGSTVMRNGTLTLYSGSTGNNLTVTRDGKLFINAGAAGNTLNVTAGGDLAVSGVARGIRVQKDGTLTVKAGGVCSNVDVDYSGTLVVEEGSYLTGTGSFALYSTVAIRGTLNFDLTCLSAGNSALFRSKGSAKSLFNYGRIDTITISDSQGLGTYNLTYNLHDLNYFSLLNVRGESLGMFSLNGVTGSGLVVDGRTYILRKNNSSITLTISETGDTNVLYVNTDWAGLAAGTLVQTTSSSSGPTAIIGYDAFGDLHTAEERLPEDGFIIITGGTYASETISIGITMEGGTISDSAITATGTLTLNNSARASNLNATGALVMNSSAKAADLTVSELLVMNDSSEAENITVTGNLVLNGSAKAKNVTASGMAVVRSADNAGLDGTITIGGGATLTGTAEFGENSELAINGKWVFDIAGSTTGNRALFRRKASSSASTDPTSPSIIFDPTNPIILDPTNPIILVSQTDADAADPSLTVTGDDAQATGDLLMFRGDAQLVITVSDTQELGLYNLASGIAGFENAVFTIVNTTGATVATLAVGEDITVDGKYYKLACTAETAELTLTIANEPNSYRTYVNSAWKDKAYGDLVQTPDGAVVYGMNAFADLDVAQLSTSDYGVVFIVGGTFGSGTITRNVQVSDAAVANLTVSGYGTLTLNSGAAAKDIAVSAGSLLTVNAGATLTVTSSEFLNPDAFITIYGKLILDISGTRPGDPAFVDASVLPYDSTLKVEIGDSLSNGIFSLVSNMTEFNGIEIYSNGQLISTISSLDVETTTISNYSLTAVLSEEDSTLRLVARRFLNGYPYVNPDWAGLEDGTLIEGHTIGYDAFATLEEAEFVTYDGLMMPGSIYILADSGISPAYGIRKKATLVRGRIENTTVMEDVRLSTYKDTALKNLVVDGTLDLNSSSTTENVVVNGTLNYNQYESRYQDVTVSESGVMKGWATFGEDCGFTINGFLNFDLDLYENANQNASWKRMQQSILFRNLYNLKGNVQFSLTTGSARMNEKHTLASGVTASQARDAVFTVLNTFDERIGEVPLGESTAVGSNVYTINLEDDCFVLTITQTEQLVLSSEWVGLEDGTLVQVPNRPVEPVWKEIGVTAFYDPDVLMETAYKINSVSIICGSFSFSEGITTQTNVTGGKMTGDVDIHDSVIASALELSGYGFTSTVYSLSGRNLTVLQDGILKASSNVRLDSITVRSGARFTLNLGTLTGHCIFEEGSDIKFTNTCLDFDISGTTAGAPARYEGFSCIQGTNVFYTLTVSGTQEYGDYLLATGVTEFADSITISVDGVQAGGVEVGKKSVAAGKSFTLKLQGGSLILRVAEYVPPSVIYLNSDWRKTPEDTVVEIPGGTAVIGYDAFATADEAVYYAAGSDATIAITGGTFAFASGIDSDVSVVNGAVRDSVVRKSLTVGAGASAWNLQMAAGGTLTAEAGGKLTGWNIFTEGANITVNGTLDFDISAKMGSTTYLYSGLSFVQGSTNYTLTVRDFQSLGQYALADGVTEFKSTITVVNSAGTQLGRLSLGTTTIIGDKAYRLTLNDGVLSVALLTPEKNRKCDVDGNGVSDVLFQYTGGDDQTGYWLNGKDTWRSSNAPHPAEWTLLGAYDMDGDGLADSVFVGNGVVVNDVKGAYIGYYKGGIDTDENWVNISFLENEAENVWVNKIGNLTGNAGANSIVWHCAGLGAIGVWTDSTNNWVSLGVGFDSNWTLVGCGDFNGDGRDSIVMSYANGAKYYAIGIDGSAVDMGSLNWAGWEVRAIGDFKGDGKDDMILFHKEYGAVVMIADGKLDSYTSIGQLAADDWFIVGCGDYDGDHKDDLLVRQYSSGMLGYYSSGDTSKWVELGRGVDMDWTVIA